MIRTDRGAPQLAQSVDGKRRRVGKVPLAGKAAAAYATGAATAGADFAVSLRTIGATLVP